MVEGVGFEPTRPLRTHQFSRLALSTAQPPLRDEEALRIKHEAFRERGEEETKNNYEEWGRRDRRVATP